jgi:hypothetical protein
MSQFELENFLLQQSIKALERQYPPETSTPIPIKEVDPVSKPESIAMPIAPVTPPASVVVHAERDIDFSPAKDPVALLESAPSPPLLNPIPITQTLPKEGVDHILPFVDSQEVPTLPLVEIVSKIEEVPRIAPTTESVLQLPVESRIEIESIVTSAAIVEPTTDREPAPTVASIPAIENTPKPSLDLVSESLQPSTKSPELVGEKLNVEQIQHEPGMMSQGETQSILEAAAQKLVALSESQQLDASDSAIQNILQTISQCTEPVNLDPKDQFLYCKQAMLKILQESLGPTQRYHKAPTLPNQIDEWRDQRVTSDLSKMIAGTIRESVSGMFQKHDQFEIQGKELLLLTPFPPIPLSGSEIVQKCGQILTNVYKSCFEPCKTADSLLPVIKTAVTMQAKEFTNLRPDEIAVKQAIIDDLFAEYFDEAFQTVYELFK